MRSIQELRKLSVKNKSLLWNDRRAFGKPLPKPLHSFLDVELRTMQIMSITDAKDICTLLRQSHSEVQRHIDAPVYETYQVPKKKGGFRQIQAPGDRLKQAQWRINRYLQAYYSCVKPPEAFGFVQSMSQWGQVNSNIVANAGCHVGRKYILNMDLKDFFPGISDMQVYNVFAGPDLGFDQDIATAFTLLTTYNRQLPTGAPSSPVLSNLVCMGLDKALQHCAVQMGYRYSRYADDLTFSSDERIMTEHVQQISAIISAHGFAVNTKKTRIVSHNRQQTVTGLVVNERVNVNRNTLKKVRAMIHDAVTNGRWEATRKHYRLVGQVDKVYVNQFLGCVEGYLGFIGQVRGLNDKVYLSLREQFNGILDGGFRKAE